MKLISMTDFVLEQDSRQGISKMLSKILSYAEFLKQPLTLGMFVPVDDYGVVLEEPNEKEQEGTPFEKPFTPSKEYLTYQKAKGKVLFEGFECMHLGFSTIVIQREENVDDRFISIDFYRTHKVFEIKGIEHKTIDDLINYDLKLTESAIKQIGL